MPDASGFLSSFALVLCIAAVTTAICTKLRQSVVLGYLIAGLLIGPHMLPSLSADRATIETLAQLGVILLVFAIGLEFSIRRLLRIGGSIAVIAIIDVSLMAWLGIGVARGMHWTLLEALFTGAMITTSSTTIIAKTLEEKPVGARLRDRVMGVLVVEDLVAVLVLAGLGAIALRTASAPPLYVTTLRLVVLLVIWVVLGLVLIPRLVRRMVATVRAETVVVMSVGFCFASALLAHALGFSVALGAFIAGSLIAESGRSRQVTALVRPVRDVFAAVFFVAIGMLIDPAMIVRHAGAIVLLTVVVLFGKLVAVGLGTFLTGEGIHASIRTGLSMAQIGEFSFIIVSLGAATGAIRPFFLPVAVAVSAITLLLTPLLSGSSDRIASLIDRKLPRPLQTYATLYAGWLDDLRTAPGDETRAMRVRKLVRWLLIDAMLTGLVLIAVLLAYPWITRVIGGQLSPRLVALLLVVIGLALATPFGLGLGRTAQRLAIVLSRAALPSTGRVDRAMAPRQALVVTLEIAILLLTALPLLAITQPFLPPFGGALVPGAILVILAVAAWRSARNLEGHLRAGAEVLVDAVRSTLPPEQTAEMSIAGMTVPDQFATATHLLPGFGAPTAFRIEPAHAAVGKTLAELALRGRTGATVLGITRDGSAIPAPSKTEKVLAGDTLILVGARSAVAAAIGLLQRGSIGSEPGMR